MASWTFGSNFSPVGSNSTTPCLDRVFSNSDLVIWTPENKAVSAVFSAGMGWGTYFKAVVRMSTVGRRSCANFWMAYSRAVTFSVSVRFWRLIKSALP